MKNIQLLGLLLVVVGSFLPLVHIPVIGNWNYWKVDHNLAIICWVLSACALFGIVNNTTKIVNVFGILLLILFGFTLMAIKLQSVEYFNFIPFKSWRKTIAGVVELRWGWAVEFAGAIIMILAKRNKNKELK